jgi:GNAT superfamily N-acetyltransferase
MSAITCRMATVEDCAALTRLRAAMEIERHPERSADADAYSHAFLAAEEPEVAAGRHRYWLAEADGEAVACALLVWIVMPPNFAAFARKRGFVSSVYTVPEYRRQGIARRLMTDLLAWAEAEGLSRLILWSSDMGRPLYEDLGFIPSRGMELNL